MRMRNGAFAVAAMLLLLPACTSRRPTGTVTPTTGPLAAKDFDPANFAESWIVDNRWFPLEPGTKMVFEGHAFDDEERIRRRVVVVVTDLTKEIAGVRATIVRELDFTNGRLEEAELAFFAQDAGGTVWHLGEYPEEYEDGEIVKTPAWIAGSEGAAAGVQMQADPRSGTRSYAQGWGPRVGWNDRGRVDRLGGRTCVPVACYDDILVTREFSWTEPGAYQRKLYAPGVGTVRVGWGGAQEEEREVLVLRALVHLDDAALATVRAEVVEQEDRAYERSPGAYGPTERAASRPAG